MNMAPCFTLFFRCLARRDRIEKVHQYQQILLAAPALPRRAPQLRKKGNVEVSGVRHVMASRSVTHCSLPSNPWPLDTHCSVRVYLCRTNVKERPHNIRFGGTNPSPFFCLIIDTSFKGVAHAIR
jgi:hypothetical protein